MLRTRLWMGAILIALVLAVLFVDSRFEPGYPFWFALIAGLSAAATFELLDLLRPEVRPSRWLCSVCVLALVLANWVPHLEPSLLRIASLWLCIAIAFAACVLAVFLVEMATFREPGSSVTRMALAVWLLAYLGVLPSFLAQLRWLSRHEQECTAALMLTVFVPKCCDIGAYFTGRLLGKHKMTPVLSPKKTWEGAAGGLAAAILTTVLLDRLGPAPLLREDAVLEIGFGLSVGVAGMLGDLAESLIKRDCRQKDASHVVPGFGGVLDVVDAILFAAPVAYGWFVVVGPLAA
jgi:phosphatidate cytidylyltransferase